MFSGMGDIAVIALEEVSVEKKIFHRRIFALKQCPEYSSTEMSNAEYSIPEIQMISHFRHVQRYGRYCNHWKKFLWNRKYSIAKMSNAESFST